MDHAGSLINDTYRVGSRLGKGSFGTTYRGINVHTNYPVAIKIEHTDKKAKTPSLQIEFAMYSSVHPGRGIPSIEWFGKVTNGRHHTLVMELMGPSLESVRQKYEHGRLPITKVQHLGLQILRRLEHCHSRGVLHRDIKPENLVLGRDRHRRRCFLVDFGLAKHYLHPTTRQHIPIRHGKNLTGSARYCSLATHEGVEQSRRDDLESLAYTLIYLICGKLPWQGLQGKKAERYLQIKRLKRDTSLTDICGAKTPPQFSAFLQYCRKLEFHQTPKYTDIRNMFKGLLRQIKRGQAIPRTGADLRLSLSGSSSTSEEGARASHRTPYHSIESESFIPKGV